MEDDFDLVDELCEIIESDDDLPGVDETEADEIEADASDYAFGSESYGDFESADDYWASYDGDI